MPLIHHELCFGCGRANLFGLLAELEPGGEDRVAGRCFIKQDHQGPEPGFAHPGVVALALIEALTFAAGETPAGLEIRFHAPAPVGTFLEVLASGAEASAHVNGRATASAHVAPRVDSRRSG